MKKLVLNVIIFGVGVIAGEWLLRHAYDPKKLEDNALNFAGHAFETGCILGIVEATGNVTWDNRTWCVNRAQQMVNEQDVNYRKNVWKK